MKYSEIKKLAKCYGQTYKINTLKAWVNSKGLPFCRMDGVEICDLKKKVIKMAEIVDMVH